MVAIHGRTRAAWLAIIASHRRQFDTRALAIDALIPYFCLSSTSRNSDQKILMRAPFG